MSVLEFPESVSQCEFLVKQSGEKPVGEKVQPDMRADAEFVPAVVPGLKIFWRQQGSGGEFAEEDEQSVETAAQGKAHVMRDAV